MFKADHTPCHGSRFWLVCWRYERDNPEGIEIILIGDEIYYTEKEVSENVAQYNTK